MQQPTTGPTDRHESSFDERVGAELRALRVERGLTQREVALRMGQVGVPIDATAITRIEKGSRSIRFEEVVAIANVLEASVERLMWSANDSAELTLRRMRDQANSFMHEAREAALNFVSATQRVRRGMDALPNALPGTTPEGYYDWVLGRLKAIWEPNEAQLWPDVLFETDEGDAQKLQLMADELVRGLVKVGNEPVLTIGDHWFVTKAEQPSPNDPL